MSILAVYISVIAAFTVHVSVAANCGSESREFHKCVDTLTTGIAASAGNSASEDQQTKYQEAATACFSDNGCPLDDSSVTPGVQDQFTTCQVRASANYKAAMESCVQASGDSAFSLEDRSKLQKDGDHSVFGAKVRQGYKSCSDAGISPSVINKCIQGKLPPVTPKPAAASNGVFGSSSGGNPFGSFFQGGGLNALDIAKNLQNLMNPFKNLCTQKSTCYNKVSEKCTSSVCRCFTNQSDAEQKISADIKSCLNEASVVDISEDKVASLALQVQQDLMPGYCISERNKDPCAAGSVLDLLSGKPLPVKGGGRNGRSGNGGFPFPIVGRRRR